MAAPRVPEARFIRVVEIVNECFQEGYEPGKGAFSEAGRRCVREKLFNNSIELWRHLEVAKERHGLEPDESQFRQFRYQQPAPKLQLLPAAEPVVPAAIGARRRVLVIPDRHNDPRHPHRLLCTTWIARHGSEIKYDDVVCLGDDGTYDSCSRHDKNDTLKGRLKPFIRDDLDNFEAQEQHFERGRDPSWKPRKLKCRGNHNQRLWDFENQHPESEGTHTHRYAQLCLQFGWRERPFGEIFYIENVGFTHAPLVQGKAIGGVTGVQRTSNGLCRSLVHGHTHKFHWYDAPKNDPRDLVEVVAAGCALPDGEVEHYATHGGSTGWRYGVLDITVEAGRITDHAWVSMRSLRERYSDDGADIAA
jgi:hypothetical protein